MTARPWGTTGRVTLKQYVDTDDVGHADYDVLLDGENVGRALCVSADDEWEASEPYSKPTTLPSLDAAVMWVLRRADADVWRQERGSVWRVKSDPAVRDRYRYRWRVYMPGGAEYTTSGATGTREGWEWALREVAKELTWAAALGPTP